MFPAHLKKPVKGKANIAFLGATKSFFAVKAANLK
jgi:hypothetical protein